MRGEIRLPPRNPAWGHKREGHGRNKETKRRTSQQEGRDAPGSLAAVYFLKLDRAQEAGGFGRAGSVLKGREPGTASAKPTGKRAKGKKTRK